MPFKDAATPNHTMQPTVTIGLPLPVPAADSEHYAAMRGLSMRDIEAAFTAPGSLRVEHKRGQSGGGTVMGGVCRL